MLVTPYKTPLVNVGDDLFEILKSSLPKIQEKDVVVITSKIVALAEKAVVKISDSSSKEEKWQIVKETAERYIDPHSSKYQLMLTVKQQVLAVNAGIDESNADGYYVLWPKNPQESANQIWRWLRETYGVKEVGVILSDGRTFPLKWGVIGTSIAHCGFVALNDKRGMPDLFGKPLVMTQINVSEALAVAAAFEMGESNESTPIAIVKDATQVMFQDHVPTEDEMTNEKISLEDDVYAPILQKAQWQKGSGS